MNKAVINMEYQKTKNSLDCEDHDLLMRIDERIGQIHKAVETQDIEIDDLKMWKNRMAGGLSIVLGISGYSFIF